MIRVHLILAEALGSWLVIDQGHHTGAKPGHVLRGAGYGAQIAGERAK